jgi:hypothetical protein
MRQELQENAFCFLSKYSTWAGGPIRELPYTKDRELPHAAECPVKPIFFLVLTYVREYWPLATQDENILRKFEIDIMDQVSEILGLYWEQGLIVKCINLIRSQK